MSKPTPLEAIFFAALEKAPDQRAAYLNEACAGDENLRRRVERMLAAQSDAASFLEAPPSAVVSAANPTVDQPLSESPGTQIGPYKLLQQIGEGGFGIVFMAEQMESVRRRVALKVIKPGMDTRQVIARFEAERQALAMMDHPNIARVLDAGATESGRPYFVMELVRGSPITQYCDENNLPVRERLDLFTAVCQAIQHAHTKGIIHRDIKPTNVLVTRQDGRPIVKVIDFGIAKALGPRLTDKTLLTDFTQMIGTPLYMSPEQAELSSNDIDTRSDIYSLGVLLYELLTGSTPVSKEQLKQAAIDEIRRIIREDEPPKPSSRISTAEAAPSIAAQRHTEPAKLARLVRGELDWIVMKALEKDRSRRYETASGFAMDVQRFLADEPVQAGPPSAGYRLRKFVRRNKAPVFATALVVSSLILGILATTWQAVRTTRERDDKEKARVEAAAQAAIARAVTDFLLKDLLQQADWNKRLTAADWIALRFGKLNEDVSPGVREAFERADKVPFDVRLGTVERQRAWAASIYLAKPNPTVWELLERSGQAVEGKFKDQPLTEAAVRQALAETYLVINPFAMSGVADSVAPHEWRIPIEHAERAVALRMAHLGPDHADTLASKQTLAEYCVALGKVEQALSLSQDIIARRTRILGATHSDTLASKQYLAFVYQGTGKTREAEPLYREIIAARTASLGPGHANTILAKGSLGRLYFDQKKYAQAETLLKELVAAPAEDLTAKATQRGAKHMLLESYHALGKHDQAEPLLKEMIEEAAQTFAGQPWEVHEHFVDALASAYLAQGKEQQAEQLYHERMPQPDRHDILARLAKLYQSQRKHHDAERLLKKAIDGVERDLEKGDGDGGDYLDYRIQLAGVYKEQRRYDDAERAYKELLGQEIPLEHVPKQQCIEGLADLYERMKEPAKAEPLRREFADIQNPNYWNYVGALADLGRNLLTQRKWGEAETVLRECIAVHERHEPDMRTAYHTKGMLGAALLGQHKYDEAEPLLLAGYKGLREVGGDYVAQGYSAYIPPDQRLIEASQRLVELYDAWGKPEEATKWGTEVEKWKKLRREPRLDEAPQRRYSPEYP